MIMLRRIFMYLFVFTLLLVIFQYVNSKSIIDKYEKDITTYKTKIKKQDTLINTLLDQKRDLSIFKLDENDDALNYFEAQNISLSGLTNAIKEGLYKTNSYTGEQHPMVPFASLTGNKIVINTIRVLNHKWLIANFSDGKYWGEILVAFDVDANQNVTYELNEYLLYPVLN